MYRSSARREFLPSTPVGARGFRDQRLSRAATATLEVLETRRMLCALHNDDAIDSLAPTASQIVESLKAPGLSNKVVNYGLDWYKAAGRVRVTIPQQSNKPVAFMPSATSGSTGSRSPGAVVAGPLQLSGTGASTSSLTGASTNMVTLTTNAAGLPLLSSRSDGAGMEVFIDFDGYSDASVSDTGYSLDSDYATFNSAEQAAIYDVWRDIVSYLSPYNVNVTTVQPPTGGSNPAFVWQRITNSRAGGAAYVGWITNDASHGYNNSDNVTSRHSGIYHELGHQLSLNHQSDYDNYGNKTAEYTGGFDSLQGPIMGIDYNGQVKKYYNGRSALAADSFQNDQVFVSGKIASLSASYGDGYRPDDFTGTTYLTASALTTTNGSFQTTGIIERMTDADWFSFSSSGGLFDVNVEPTFDSALAPKLEIYNSTGTLISSVDDAVYRYATDNNSEEVNINLPAGTYYARVSSHGDISDLGEYAFFASPLPTNWGSADVNKGYTGNGGYVTYDPSTSTFYQGGTGNDIWGTSDAFRFTYQVLTGDGSITAHVASLVDTGSFAKAGVMIRQSLAANSQHAYIGTRPSGALEGIQRSTSGASATNPFASPGTGSWIRVTRTGNTFTYSQSTDGVTWSTVGSSSISMTGAVYIGLAVCSWNTGNQTDAVFDHVALTGTLGTTSASTNALTAPVLAGAPVSTQSTAMTLTWADVSGETGYAIERSTDGVTFTQIATTAANAVSYTDDPGFGSMRWWYRIAALNGSTLSTYSNSVNIQNKPKAPFNAQLIRMGSTELSLYWRDISGDTGYRIERSTDGGTNYSTITTTGQSITTYNNTGLTPATTYTYRITPLSAAGDGVPMVVSSTTRPVAATSLTLTQPTPTSTALKLDWAQVSGATSYQVYRSTDNGTFNLLATLSGGSTVTYTDSSTIPLTNYYYYVAAVTADGTLGVNSATVKGSSASAQSLPSNWLQADVGSVTGLGKTGPGATAGSFIQNASGSDIANTADSFHFTYISVSADTSIITRVASISATDTAAKAGVMVRQSLNANSAFAGIFINQGNSFGIDTRTRTTAGAQYVYSSALSGATVPYYLKVARVGGNVTMSYSSDGTTFTAAKTLALSLSGTFYVGLASTASSTTLMNTSSFTDTQVSSGTQVASAIAADQSTMIAGLSQKVSVLDQYGLPMSARGATWSASVGQMTPDGVYIAPATGSTTATITGTYGGSVLTTSVTILTARAWYKADSTTGGSLADASGNSYNGTLTTTYALDTAGALAQAVSLTGGYATLPAAVLNGLTDFTVSAWVKPTATTNWGRLLDFGTGTSNYMFIVPADGSGYVRFGITTGGGGAEQTVTSTTTLTNNVWSHIAVTLSGATATLYVNGVAVGSNSSMTLKPASLGTTTQNWLGRSQYSDPTFKGSIDDLRVFNTGLSSILVGALYNATQAPTVATAPAAAPSSVTGVSTDLSVLGNDAGGEGTLTYNWTASGPANVAFTGNGANASKNSTAMFIRAGTYFFTVFISDGNYAASSTLTVTVVPVLGTITLSPDTVSLQPGQTQTFAATAMDQFGETMATPALTWSTSGVGSVGSSGVYTASLAGSATVFAKSGSITGSATVQVEGTGPTVASAASAGQTTVTTQSTTLSVLGADPGGESGLIYTWSVVSGASSVAFASNNSNAAKNTTATFNRAGTYVLRASINNGTSSVTSDVTVNVVQTAASVSVTPTSASIGTGQTKQYTASAVDQFGQPIVNPPVTWSIQSGGGSIANGLFTAPSTAGQSIIKATLGSRSATSTATIFTWSPYSLTASRAGSTVSLKFKDSTTIESGFQIQVGRRQSDGTILWGSYYTTGLANGSGSTVTYNFGTSFTSGTWAFRVRATSASGYSNWSNTALLTL